MLDLTLVIVAIMILVVGIVVLVAYNIMTQMISGFTSAGIPTAGLESARTAVHIWDYGMLFFVFALGIINIISAFVIRTHPVFFVMTLILLGIMGILAPAFSNVYNAVSTSIGSATTS